MLLFFLQLKQPDINFYRLIIRIKYIVFPLSIVTPAIACDISWECTYWDACHQQLDQAALLR